MEVSIAASKGEFPPANPGNSSWLASISILSAVPLKNDIGSNQRDSTVPGSIGSEQQA